MEITQKHISAFLDVRDNSFRKGVTASGVFRNVHGEVISEILHEAALVQITDLLGGEGDVTWRTILRGLKGSDLAEVVLCSYDKQRVVDAVLLCGNVFWRITMAPRANNDIGKIIDNLKRIKDPEKSLVELNSTVTGMGRIEMSPYVVVENPALSRALNFFRRHACDVDWVKQQVYGKRLLYVPENFPRDIPTPEEVVRRCKSD